MATALASPPITVEQYLGFEGYPGLRDELINGRIVLSPQPKPHHQEVVENVYLRLREIFASSRYVVKQNTNIRLGAHNSMPAPDVFVVSKESWQHAVATDSYLAEAPLIVLEVLSPANRRRQVEEKAFLYLSRGVAAVFLVDLKRQSVLEAKLVDGIVQKHSVDAMTMTEPVAFSIPASEILDLHL